MSDQRTGSTGLLRNEEICTTLQYLVRKSQKKNIQIKNFNKRVAALLGGENKHDQWKELKAGVEIIIATPGITNLLHMSIGIKFLIKKRTSH